MEEIVNLHALNEPTGLSGDKKLGRLHGRVKDLVDDLLSRTGPAAVEDEINAEIDKVNGVPDSRKELKKGFQTAYSRITQIALKRLNLVPKGYYRTMWMSIGLGAFGVPIGVSIGVVLDNMGFIGVGLPLGMVIGMAVGSAMDKRAAEEGRQLSIEE